MNQRQLRFQQGQMGLSSDRLEDDSCAWISTGDAQESQRGERIEKCKTSTGTSTVRETECWPSQTHYLSQSF